MWDSFIQGTGLDTAAGFWPMNMDASAPLADEQTGDGSAQQEQQQMPNLYSGNAGWYMGPGASQRNAR